MKKKILILGSIFVVIDQIIKHGFICSNIIYNQIISLIPNFFYLTYVKNTGGAFSIFDNNIILLILVSFICMGVFFYYINSKDKFNNLEVIYLSMIFGGIVGNFIDRIICHGVIDYLGFIFGNYYFPIFNFADIIIVCGVGLFLLSEIKGGNNL